jgi:hypothetical protein
MFILFACNAMAATLTAGYVPKALSGKVIVDSVIYEDGSNVGIGSASPRGKLDVGGNIYTDSTIYGGAGSFSADVTIYGVKGLGIGSSNPVAYLDIGGGALTSVDGANDAHISDSLEIDNNIYVDKSIYLTSGASGALFISQPDEGCSKCGVDAAGTTWSCINVTCPLGM